mmetsp:Transcript_49110/g.88289  ORF Transcript_49110/g.88289 Transcript_49110/m.88289 type:complete len:80 (+) Transcript_49110:212-451(+)
MSPLENGCHLQGLIGPDLAQDCCQSGSGKHFIVCEGNAAAVAGRKACQAMEHETFEAESDTHHDQGLLPLSKVDQCAAS